MKNTNKAFTLVELIVVITILAILGTIAFISLQGYSQDAKNSKVSSDLGTLASAIEISNTKGDTTIKSLLDDSKNTNVVLTDNGNGTFGSGITITDGTTAGIGWVSFTALNQNGADFKDREGRDYVYAYAASGSIAYYQIAGQIKTPAWAEQVYVKGNYVQKVGTDALWLIAKSWSLTVGLQNNDYAAINNY